MAIKKLGSTKGTDNVLVTSVNLATETTGTLPVASGGTGQSVFTDGQLLIGNTTGNTLTKATLTAGTNVTITNGNGSITIAATGGSVDTSLLAKTSELGTAAYADIEQIIPDPGTTGQVLTVVGGVWAASTPAAIQMAFLGWDGWNYASSTTLSNSGSVTNMFSSISGLTVSGNNITIDSGVYIVDIEAKVATAGRITSSPRFYKTSGAGTLTLNSGFGNVDFSSAAASATQVNVSTTTLKYTISGGSVVVQLGGSTAGVYLGASFTVSSIGFSSAKIYKVG